MAAVLIMMLTFLTISFFTFLLSGSSRVINFFESKPQVTAFFKNEAKQSDKWSEYKELYRVNPLIKYVEESFMINGVKHLTECIEQYKTPISNGEDARESLALICAFHESAKEDGKKVVLPLKNSKIIINIWSKN